MSRISAHAKHYCSNGDAAVNKTCKNFCPHAAYILWRKIVDKSSAMKARGPVKKSKAESCD